MDRQEIEKKIKEIIADKLKISIEKITPEALLREDLGMDSFGAVEVIFEIEDAFDINVPQEQTLNIKTFKNMVDSITEFIAKK
ncbi:MAG: acyl carrier protein [Candidatus Omnitrophica bacterium]|nr:acyl carrier protein [Candidatus Omnitrophota bacterium]